MARRRKSGITEVLGVLLLVVLAAIAAIPKEVWIALVILGAIGAGIYFFGKSKTSRSSEENETDVSPPQVSAFTIGRSRARSDDRSGQDRRSTPAAADTPVSVGQTSQTDSEFRIPNAPAGYGNAKWIPAGESLKLAGTLIPGGMLYVGTSLSTPSGANDPCLIDPSKSVAASGDYTERQTGYWPSYSEIPATARRAYLNWLAGGRKDPEADIGYVFIFFYGLERRAIVDAANDDAAHKDWPLIATELRRLLAIYGEKSGSFRRYAGSLLDWVSLADLPEKAYLQPVPSFPKTYELPLYIRAALGQSAVDKAPVPAHLALAWVRLDPSSYLKTPATRCAEEFDKLFVLKYREMFDEGIVLPKNRTKLKLVHQPASAGFQGYGELRLTFGELPDVTVLTAPMNKLRQAVDASTKALEPYSRYVGKNPNARQALEGFLQLPATLWPDSARDALQTIKTRMGGGMLTMSFKELLATLDAQSELTKDKTLALARALESMNIGLEPDVLSGARLPKSEEKIVLFDVPPSEVTSRSTPAYQAAALTLQVASAVATADGEFSPKEVGHLREQVQSWTHLTPNHLRRLLAHLRLLMMAPVSLAAVKKKIDPLDPVARHTIAAFMATVVQSDGEVTPAEVKILEKVYKALGVEATKVFSDVHAVAAGTAPSAAPSGQGAVVGFKLDPARIAALQQDTATVSTLLASIFTEDDAQTSLAPDAETPPEVEALATGIMGLDDAHTALARMMLSRPSWTREELLDVAADLELMLDGALEHINEAAYDRYDMPFTEGENPVTVNPEIVEKVDA